jgi:NAD+ synthase (glutamine-hydrolysing)
MRAVARSLSLRRSAHLSFTLRPQASFSSTKQITRENPDDPKWSKRDDQQWGNKHVQDKEHPLREEKARVEHKRDMPHPLRLHPDLHKKLVEYRKTKRNFNADDWIRKKCELYNNYMRQHKLSAAVVSMSGGIDSAVTGALMKHASEKEDSPIKKILAIAQPIHSSKWATDRAIDVSKSIGIPLITVDQTKLFDSLSTLVEREVGIEGKTFAQGQLRSYMRTPVGYYVAQLLTQQGTPCVVMGTGNQDEDGYLAYFCKAGDGVIDIQLIADLHKSEVYAVGAKLNLPEGVLKSAPSADLWEGQTDEGELGFSYDFVELFTGAYLPSSDKDKEAFRSSLSQEALEQFDKWRKAAEAVHSRNKHKLGGPANLNILKSFLK